MFALKNVCFTELFLQSNAILWAKYKLVILFHNKWFLPTLTVFPTASFSNDTTNQLFSLIEIS